MRLSEITRNKIGPNGVTRFEEFKKYSDNFRLSSVMFNELIKKAGELIPEEPNICISIDGILGISWDFIMVSCGPAHYKYDGPAHPNHSGYSHDYIFVAKNLDIFIDKLRERLK